MWKPILLVVVLILVAALGFYLLVSGTGQPATSDTAPSVPAAQSQTKSSGQSITVNGWLMCLPHKVQATDCAIGIVGQDNKYYALVDASGNPVDPTMYTTGKPTTITGMQATNTSLQTNYLISGVIELTH